MSKLHFPLNPVYDAIDLTPAHLGQAEDDPRISTLTETPDSAYRMAQESADAQRNDAEWMAWDAVHCRVCSKVTAGSEMFGAHVQACDACILDYVRAQMGVQLA